MQLFTLLFGKSKKKMRPIMIDARHKCEQYRDTRQSTKGTKAGEGWYDIVEAGRGAVPWKQRTATRGGNKPDGKAGYISKNGFNFHT